MLKFCHMVATKCNNVIIPLDEAGAGAGVGEAGIGVGAITAGGATGF